MVKHSAAQTKSARTAVPLLLVLLLAFGLRVYHLDSFSFWTDEGLTPLRSGYTIAEILSNQITIQDGVGNDTHPPLFYLLIHFSRKIFGETDFAYRYPSLLAGVLLVPLMYQFGRRLRGKSLGLVSASLVAINPLQIWYASEARMYTLLILFAALASYFLWLALTTERALGRFLILYLLSASLAFYTHYSAIFLIAGQMVFWLWLLWQKGQRRLLLALLAIALLIVLPMVPFTLPRLFTGAEANYFYVPPLIMLQDVVYGFSLGVTFDFSSLLIKALAAGALGLLVSGFIVALIRDRLRASFLLIYLLAVVFGLMVGSFLKPMYQGVRHIMVGSPAFLLLVGEGILWIKSKTSTEPGWLRSMTWWSLSVGGLVVLLAGPLTSLGNLYFDTHYAKDDFRSLIRYAEARAGENDVIVYNNAILLPLHQHYQSRADTTVTASPVYPHNSASSPPQLESLAEQFDRIWFVTDPPASGLDFDRIVRRWLDSNLTVVDEHSFLGRTTEVKLIAYATAPRWVEDSLETDLALSIQWENLPAPHGLELDFAQPTNLPTLWFDLIWQSDLVPSADTQLRFSLRDPNDKERFVFNHPLLRQASNSWPDNGYSRQSYFLPLPIGMPPGSYALDVQPFSERSGAILGDTKRLTNIELAAHTYRHGSRELLFLGAPAIRFANDLILETITMPAREVRPGHSLPLELYWYSVNNLSLKDVRYQLDVIRLDGSPLRSQTTTPGATWLTQWPSDTVIKESTGLYFPPDTEPGIYRLRWRLFEGDQTAPGRLSWRPWSSETVTWGEVEVLAWSLVTELPIVDTEVGANFGSAIELYGYNLDESDPDSLDLTLYWRAEAVPDDNYFTFVHLVATDGEIVAQQDRIPVDNLRPTAGWRAGEVLADKYSLRLPSEMPAGIYQLIIGFFKPSTMERLPVIYQGSPQADNQLQLTTFSAP